MFSLLTHSRRRYLSNADGTKKQYTFVIPGAAGMQCREFVGGVDVDARDASSKFTLRVNHGPTEEGPWENYGPTAGVVTEASTATGFFTGKTAAATHGPSFGFLQAVLEVEATGGTTVVGLTLAAWLCGKAV